MRTRTWVRRIAVILMLVASGCETPTAQVSSISTRTAQYDRSVKRIVVVLGNLGVLKSQTVRTQLLDQLKSNAVNALVLEHDPLLLTPDPIAANRDAVRVLRPQALLHVRVLQWTNS